MHPRGDEVRIFTHNLEVTDRLPEVAATRGVAALPIDFAVLDGEAIAVEGSGRPRPFQDTMWFGTSRPVQGASAPRRVIARFFDVIHIDGDDLIDRPLGCGSTPSTPSPAGSSSTGW